MPKLIQNLVDVREGESKRLLIMAGYIFVIIASYNVLKPMTRSLFVTTLGLRQLPILYMLLAIVVAAFVAFYLKFSASLKLQRLLNITLLSLMASLLFFRWMLQLHGETPALYYALFIWASIYGVLTTSQYWLLANYVFNARAARRLFPVLTSSALAGAILGGYFTRFFVNQIGGTANLGFICFGLLLIAQALMNLAWRHRDRAIGKSRRATATKQPTDGLNVIRETVAIIRNSRHLAYIITIVGMTYMVVQIADFQFIAFASQAMRDTDELTGFLGLWLSNLSIIALLFQILFAGRILRKFGVGVTILFLPVALLVTSAWVLVSYGLVSILAIKVGDGAFRHSINKVGMELLYLPAPQELKRKTKTFIDMFADRFARGLAGVILLIFYTWLGLSVAHISVISLVLSGVWLVIAVAAYREYINSFRQAIARREIDLDAASLTITDAATIGSLLGSLASSNNRQVIYALQVLESVKDVELEPAVRPLLAHESAEVRRQTLNLIYSKRMSGLVAEIWPLLQDGDAEVRRLAVRMAVEFSGQGEKLAAEWLKSNDLELQGACLHYVAGFPDLADRLLNPALIHSLLQKGERARALVAEVLGLLRNEIYYCYLNDLLHDDAPEVKKSAIESAGKTRARQFIPLLIQNLSSRIYRRKARRALAEYGDSICEQLASYLKNREVDGEIRVAIPRVFSLIGSQRSVDVLLDCLREPDETVRYQIIKALNKLRGRFQDLKFDGRVDPALLEEIKKYYRILAAEHLSVAPAPREHTGTPLLRRALRERLDDHLERVFRLLGLCYPPGDMNNAFAATTSPNNAVRANAIEFLDNILSNKHKRLLLPIAEGLPIEEALRNANDFLESHELDSHDALARLINSGDGWLSSCAIYHVAAAGSLAEFRREVEGARQAQQPLIAETAEFVLKKFA